MLQIMSASNQAKLSKLLKDNVNGNDDNDLVAARIGSYYIEWGCINW